MAIDEMLLDAVAEGISSNTIRFYQWNPSTASIGMHQSLSAEIHLDQLKHLGVDVVRRISGGGAVYHDNAGEITYAIICRESDLPPIQSSSRIYDESIPLRYQIILEALSQGLEQIGVSIDVGKIHCPALLTQGKKISGNAQAIRKGVILQHGTILLSVDPERMYSVLKAPEGVDYTRMVKSVRAKVTGIFQDDCHLKDLYNPTQIVNHLLHGIEKTFQINTIESPITNTEWEKTNSLIQKKYANPEWTTKYP